MLIYLEDLLVYVSEGAIGERRAAVFSNLRLDIL